MSLCVNRFYGVWPCSVIVSVSDIDKNWKSALPIHHHHVSQWMYTIINIYNDINTHIFFVLLLLLLVRHKLYQYIIHYYMDNVMVVSLRLLSSR